MKKRTFVCLALLSFTQLLTAQITLTWRDLAEVEWQEKYLEDYGIKFLVPIFGKVRQFEGKEVLIRGFVLPLDPESQEFALSMYPFASCFFCGGAGPETVIELMLNPESKLNYDIDDYLTFKGILLLNNDDPSHFNYILKHADVME